MIAAARLAPSPAPLPDTAWPRRLPLLAAGILLLLVASMAGILDRSRHVEASQRWGAVRLLQDTYDRGVYATRGRWVQDGSDPYTVHDSEYPQVATYVFGIPWLLTSDRATYDRVFPLLMALCLWALVPVTMRSLRALGLPAGRAALLLLPATIYFSLNRYDALPALLAQAALLATFGGHAALAGIALGSSILSKWYAVLFVPVLLRVHARREPRAGLTFLAALAATILLLLLSTALPWGWEAVAHPYRFHLGRPDNLSSSFHLFFREITTLPRPRLEALQTAFLVLQALPLLLGLVLPIRTPRAVASFCFAAGLQFVLFAKFYSPQWIVWITALGILGATSRVDLWFLAALDAVTYLQFPVLYHLDPAGETPWGRGGVIFFTVVGLRVALTAVLLVRAGAASLRAETAIPRTGDDPPGSPALSGAPAPEA